MKHWTEEDFRDWLYGLKSPDTHLRECSECRSESERVLAIRRRVVAEPALPSEILAAQRRNIYERLQWPATHAATRRWIAVAAALVIVLALSITLLRPDKPPQLTYSAADEKLFSDLASIENTSEPRAIQPMHNLFQ